MSRFKFRVWDKLNKEFLNRSEFVLSPFGGCTHLPSGDSGDDFILQQYTGLKDKNGKEIYEGDILKFANLNYEVIWGDGKFEATCPNYCKYNWPKFEYFGREVRCSEVVGNIFENPELLK